MFVDQNQLRVNIDAPFTSPEGVTFANLRDPEVRELLGIVEIIEPLPPDDYAEDTYYRTEQDTSPYVVYTKKSDDQLKQLANSKIAAKIAALEATQGRALREAALGRPEFLQKIEAQIVELRSKIQA